MAPEIVEETVVWLCRAMLAVSFLAEVRTKASNIRKFAKADGVPLPAAYLVTAAELAAAVAMITGILLQAAAVGLVVLMMITISMQILRWHSPFWASKGGWQYDALMLILAAVVATH